MSRNKTRPTRASVTQFVASLENPKRRAEAKELMKLYRQVTGKKPVMWGPSIIGYGKHTYAYANGDEGEMPAACFSPRKANLTFYLGDEFRGAQGLYAKLGKHKKSRACVYVNKLEDIDLKVLRELVARDFERRQA